MKRAEEEERRRVSGRDGEEEQPQTGDGQPQGGELTAVRVTQSPMGARDRYVARLRQRYPDREFADDEEVFRQAWEDEDGMERELQESRDRDARLSRMFAMDGRSAQLLDDMYNGRDPVLGLVRMFGPEIRDVLDDPAMQDKLAEARGEYLDRVARSRELDEEYERNMDATREMLRRWQQERGLSDEQVDEVVGQWLTVVEDGVMGKLTEETASLLLNALGHDADVEEARREGEVLGRNTRIVEERRRRESGDGTMPLGGAGTGAGKGQHRQTMFDLAAEAM